MVPYLTRSFESPPHPNHYPNLFLLNDIALTMTLCTRHHFEYYDNLNAMLLMLFPLLSVLVVMMKSMMLRYLRGKWKIFLRYKSTIVTCDIFEIKVLFISAKFLNNRSRNYKYFHYANWLMHGGLFATLSKAYFFIVWIST